MDKPIEKSDCNEELKAELDQAEAKDLWNDIKTRLFRMLLKIPLICFSMITLTKLWQWLIVPIFQVQSISIASAMGLILFFRYFFPPKDNKEEEEHETYYHYISYKAAKIGIFLGAGYGLSFWI